MNTQINYTYRDADNYKVHNSCVVPGKITKEQQSVILDSLDSGEFFIPSKVGLPEEKFPDFDPASDHPFFELGEYSFEYTSAAPTVSITPDELTRAFRRCKGKWESLGVSALSELIETANHRKTNSKAAVKNSSKKPEHIL